jgi:curved DNA-binding protein
MADTSISRCEFHQESRPGNGCVSEARGGGSPAGGAPGDLFLDINVESDPLFIRDGRDLHVKVRIPYSGACLGTSVNVSTLEGEKRVKVPAGMQSGSKIRLKGFGIPAREGKGDLFATIEIEVPARLTPGQKEVIEKLREEGL